MITNAFKFKSRISTLRISIGIIYLWFGALKFFPGISPAEDLATETISILTVDMIPPGISLLLLALWEVAIGLLLILNFFTRPVFWLVMVHMILTFTPLILLPQLSFTKAPMVLL